MMSLRLKGKLTFWIVLISLTVIVISSGSVMYISRNVIEEQAIELSNKVAQGNATFVKAELESSFIVARNLTTALTALKKNNAADRENANAILQGLLKNNSKLLGTWTAWEPNAFDKNDNKWTNKEFHDKTGRYIPYWYRADGKISAEPLVSYDTPGDGDYYLLAQKSGEETILDPYVYAVGGVDTLITSLVVPVEGSGPRDGVGGVDIALSDMQKTLNQIRPFEEGYLTLITKSGLIVSHPDEKLISKSFKEAGFAEEIMNALGNKAPLTLTDIDVNGVNMLQVASPLKIANTTTPWLLVVTIPKSKIFESSNHMLITVTFIALILGIGAAGVAWLFASTLSKPIKDLTGVMGDLASGNLNAEIPSRSQQDEIFDMINAVQIFKDNSLKVERMEEERKQRVEERAIADQKNREKIVSDFEESVGQVVKSVSSSADEMQSFADILEPAATQTQNQAIAGKKAAETTSENVQAVSASAEELTASIQEISTQVNIASQTASGAVVKAEQTNVTVQGLSQAVGKIGEVIDMINAIAEQTNLLALNATIEAARAGEAGKGFAVVASEVKNLANQTGQATKSITDQISNVQAATESAVNDIAGITTTINEIDAVASAIAAAVEEQGAATGEIARSTELASSGTNEVVNNISDIEMKANDTSKSAHSVKEGSAQLKHTAEELHNQVDGFIAQLRK